MAARPKKSATKKKRAATRPAKKVAPKPPPKKRAAAKPAKKAPATRKKTPATGKKATAPRKKATAPAKRRTAEVAAPPKARPPKKRAAAVPPPSPSGRVLATCAELPLERVLSDEERDAMEKVAETARRFVGGEPDGSPTSVVARIARFLDDVRLGRLPEPGSQDVRLGLGVLWGEQLRSLVGWSWVHLTYPDGFASYALVPDDRAFACFPLNRVPDALRPASTNTSAHIFESIRQDRLPMRKPKAYLVIG